MDDNKNQPKGPAAGSIKMTEQAEQEIAEQARNAREEKERAIWRAVQQRIAIKTGRPFEDEQ